MRQLLHTLPRFQTRLSSRRAGFTVVELMIVVAVIAILATIVFVAYRGVTQSANEVALKSDLQHALTELQRIQLREGAFPASVSGLPKSDGTVYDYVHTSKVFCLSATNPEYAGVVFHITQKQTIESGECPSGFTVDPPVIETSSFPSATRSLAYSANVSASGDGPLTYTASGLPAGLTINAATGAITGTPTTNGTANVTVSVTNSGGTASRTISLPVVVMAAPTYSQSTFSAQVHPCIPGYPTFSYSFAATTGNNLTYSVSSGTMPAGITLNSSTGLLSGTVPAQDATYNFVIRAQNDGGSATKSVTVQLFSLTCPS